MISMAPYGRSERFRAIERRFPALTSYELNDSSSGVRMIFVTASPVLSNEVKAYYDSLKLKLAAYLSEKAVSKRKKRQSEDRED